MQDSLANISDDESKPESSGQAVKARGLEGVVALDSNISFIDGNVGELIYRGYDIHDLAENASFEEVAYLLWNGDLPTRTQLADLNERLRAERDLPPVMLDILARMPDDANPMAALRTAVSALSLFDEEADEMSHEANYRKAVRLVARIPTVIAAFDRLRKGKEPVAPKKDCSLAHD
ncbi:MAG: citrate/2-methylcitrate synthase, partial [Rhodothermales bacterium]